MSLDAKILITGATGFVGRAVASNLNETGVDIVALVRKYSAELNEASNVQQFIFDLNRDFEWEKGLVNVNTVIHLAARVHVMNDKVSDPLTEFRRINVDNTLKLARRAADAGVKRFVFLSSVKVNGESTDSVEHCTSKEWRGINEQDMPHPIEPYAISKWEAEQGLQKIAANTGMELVIIRSPLVYGPGVKANFAAMMKWVINGRPLPFGALDNKRSLVALENLVDFLLFCSDIDKTPKAANQVFLISDGEDVSTKQLLNKVADAFGKKIWLIPFPIMIMKLIAKLIGKANLANRLFGSLQVDSSKAKNLLGWQPVITMDEQLKKTVDAFRSEI